MKLRLWFVALALVVGAGCATYSDNTRLARERLAVGDLTGGEQELNSLLGVESSRELPNDWGSETALAILERATVLQARGDYATSARDFSAAEKHLELLDIANDDAGAIASYLFSDDATKYKAPPTEKLLLNAFNMINYLARSDLEGAMVEARRFTVMRRYLQDYHPGTAHGAFGSYLAGFAAEKRGELDVAMRYYDETLQQAEVPGLHDAIRRLADRTHYRTPRLEKVIASGRAEPLGPDEGEILVVLKTGRVPVKHAERMPIGLAIGAYATHVTGDLRILERTAFKVVSYPDLVEVPDVFQGGRLRVGGARARLDYVTNVRGEIVSEYERMKPKIIGAALTRLITRAVASEGARALGNRQSGLVGMLAGLAVEGTMVAMDKPDTRSWSTLPSSVWIARLRVPAGKQQVAVDLAGRHHARMEREVEVPAGGWAVVDFTTLR